MYYGHELVSGARLFELKATYGFPLEIALDRIITQEGLAINWIEFISQARKNLWTDHQIHRIICHSLVDAEVAPEIQDGIKTRLELYLHHGA